MNKPRAVSGSRGKQTPESFDTFLQGWLIRQEHYLNELMSVGSSCHHQSSSTNDHLRDLIARVLSHYQQYYEHKSIAAQGNIFHLFSPTHFSSLERSFLWIAGFKPGLALKLASSTVADLSEEQRLRLQQLAEETRVEERGLADDLAKIQESIAAPPILEVIRRPEAGGENEDALAAIETLRAGLESVVANADSLRTATAAKVAEILSPMQNVRFFTAVTQLHVSVRSWGQQIDAEQHWKAVNGS
uniref:DOG1 domain-containing protein n=1 Tax=Kalanchoe fedtschenkoi TaxID=63787 RepID=A0A7N0TLG1_KALFE